MALNIDDMRQMQEALQARYADRWEPVDPEHGKNKILWMLAELGEAIQVVKRKSSSGIMEDSVVRHDFVEELADVLMFFNDILLCYDIKPDEFEAVYRAKHKRNMTRWKKTGE